MTAWVWFLVVFAGAAALGAFIFYGEERTEGWRGRITRRNLALGVGAAVLLAGLIFHLAALPVGDPDAGSTSSSNPDAAADSVKPTP
jgi:hypothetical protein